MTERDVRTAEGAESAVPGGVTRTPLTAWRLTLADAAGPVPATAAHVLADGVDVTVPESVLGALVRLGLAADVTVDGTEEDVAWASACTWVYRARVPRRSTGERVRLVLEGVDTLATVRVDGRPVLRTDDMFHRWVVDLGVDDAPGAWDVEVEVEPVLPVALALEAVRPLPRADVYELPYNQVRKMACSFGWDWGPVTVTSGLWRPAVVERIGAGALADVLVTAGWSGEAGRAQLGVRATTSGDVASLRVRVLEQVGTWAADVVDDRVELQVAVPGARRWDAAGRGEQALHDVEVEALAADGRVLDVVRRRVGFRDVAVRQDPGADGRGSGFEVLVNGSRVWARGFNWIPPHVLPEAAGRDHVRRLVAEAANAGATMLRVWGGGVVESDDFYDACDELGLLVWQDFSFACAAYPEDDAQVARVRREVTDAVVRVGHRACLALWCGNNENLWGHEDWGWRDALGPDGPWGARLYHQVIPQALAELDPGRPYVPGSPFSPDPAAHPNAPGQGTTHHWETWNQLDYTAFDAMESRFAAEFGWQAPASWPTLVRALGGEPAGGDDARLRRLQKAAGGMGNLDRGVRDHLPHLPSDGRGWYLATQLVQARALRAAVARFRSLHDACSGALWWQLDDCWPALSWSVLDVAGRRKLAWWAAAEVMAARAVLPTAADVPEGLTLVNDLPAPWAATGTLRVLAPDGRALAEEAVELLVPADGHVVVEPSASMLVPAEAAVVVVDVDGVRAARWLVPDAALPTAAARVTLRIWAAADDVVDLEVRADDLVRDLVVLAELHPVLVDARVDRQLRLVLPGETVRLTVTGAGVASLDVRAWAGLLAAGTPLEVTVG